MPIFRHFNSPKKYKNVLFLCLRSIDQQLVKCYPLFGLQFPLVCVKWLPSIVSVRKVSSRNWKLVQLYAIYRTWVFCDHSSFAALLRVGYVNTSIFPHIILFFLFVLLPHQRLNGTQKDNICLDFEWVPSVVHGNLKNSSHWADSCSNNWTTIKKPVLFSCGGTSLAFSSHRSKGCIWRYRFKTRPGPLCGLCPPPPFHLGYLWLLRSPPKTYVRVLNTILLKNTIWSINIYICLEMEKGGVGEVILMAISDGLPQPPLVGRLILIGRHSVLADHHLYLHCWL